MKSKYFNLTELTRSVEADRADIKNEPNSEQLICLGMLTYYCLDPLREAVGSPLIVSSGLRVPLLNERVGGAKHSAHMYGRAADLISHHISTEELVAKAIELDREGVINADQIISERSRTAHWLHIGIAEDIKANRHQYFTLCKSTGKIQLIR